MGVRGPWDICGNISGAAVDFGAAGSVDGALRRCVFPLPAAGGGCGLRALLCLTALAVWGRGGFLVWRRRLRLLGDGGPGGPADRRSAGERRPGRRRSINPFCGNWTGTAVAATVEAALPAGDRGLLYSLDASDQIPHRRHGPHASGR